MSEARLELVAAVASNGVIGRGGQLPWHLPDDLRHFKALTMGHPMIMGRRTFESIGRALPGRQSIVVSTTLDGPPVLGVELARSLDEAMLLAGALPQPTFVIGGGMLYAEALPRVGVMHLTKLDEAFEGDTFFPAITTSDWRLIREVRHERGERQPLGFRFCTYLRLRPDQSTDA